MTAEPGDGRAWVEVARRDDLGAGSGREFVHRGRAYAVFGVDDRAFVLAGTCPHQGARLAGGAVDPMGSTVTCPRRGCLRWRFDLATGRGVGLAVACATFPARVVAGAVLAALPEEGGSPGR